MVYTEQNIRAVVDAQKEYFLSGVTLPVKWRIAQLKKLKDAVKAHEEELDHPPLNGKIE